MRIAMVGCLLLLLEIAGCGITAREAGSPLSTLDLRLYGYRIRNGTTTAPQLRDWFGPPTDSRIDQQGRSHLEYQTDGGRLEVTLTSEGIVSNHTLTFRAGGHGAGQR